MSDEPNSKRRKMNRKKVFQNQSKPKHYLEPGIRGFFATCNFGEKDCVRECYNLLNEYANQMESEHENEIAIANEKPAEKETFNDSGTAAEEEEEEEDISTLLENEIKTITKSKQENRYRFQQVETNVANCLFIKTTLPNPNELGVRIVRDIAETKKRKTRMLLRFWPVDAVCRANIEDIKNASGRLFDKVFLNAEPTTFAIVFNKRHNNSIDRMKVITELAELVDFKNSAHKVDLKEPQITIVIEVIKGLCCISLLPNYFKLKKYNIHELTQVEKEKPTDSDKATAVGDGASDSPGIDAKLDNQQDDAITSNVVSSEAACN